VRPFDAYIFSRFPCSRLPFPISLQEGSDPFFSPDIMYALFTLFAYSLCSVFFSPPAFERKRNHPTPVMESLFADPFRCHAVGALPARSYVFRYPDCIAPPCFFPDIPFWCLFHLSFGILKRFVFLPSYNSFDFNMRPAAYSINPLPPSSVC